MPGRCVLDHPAILCLPSPGLPSFEPPTARSPRGRVILSVLAAGGAGAFFLVIAMFKRGGVGIGDVKRAAMTEAFLRGPAIAVVLPVAFVVGGRLLFDRGEEVFAERRTPLSSVPPKRAMSPRFWPAISYTVVSRILINSEQLSWKDFVWMLFVAWHRSCSRLCEQGAGHPHKRSHASRHRASHGRPCGLYAH